MNGRYEKFRQSRQAAVKLRIAVEDYFQEDLPEVCRSAYGTYLQQRSRPASELLIRREDTEGLQKLWDLSWFPKAQMDDLLRLAAEEHKNAAFVWLLRKKQEFCGFPPRDFSL